MSLKIEHPGLMSTLQDKGRVGFQKDGVVVGGAMDAVAMRIANLLVGNEEEDAVVEIIQHGPSIRFLNRQLIALTGAHLSARLNGEPAPLWRPFIVAKDSLLTFGKPINGRYAYLAVAGSFDVSRVMGSFSTYLQAGFGGWKGRTLQRGDVIECKTPASLGENILQRICQTASQKANWFPAPQLIPRYTESPLLRVMKGPEYEWFSENSKRRFWENEFMVGRLSNRMGYQMEGPPLSLQNKSELLSTAVTFGTIQVPSGGKPVILGADRQTIGGYPRIAQIISTDLPHFVQTLEGQAIRFREVTMEEAQQRSCQQEINLESLKRAIEVRVGFAKEKLNG